jgi:DNA-binding transcriptional MerR regulator
MGGRAISRALSTGEVARILGMPESRVRELVRAGLCQPARHGRRYAFSFQDVVVLRAAQGLLENRVPPSRVRRALSSLAGELPRSLDSGSTPTADRSSRETARRRGIPRPARPF